MTATVEHRTSVYGSGRTLFSCRDSEVVMSGPAGTGKTRACLEKLHALMLVNPGAKGLIVRKTGESLTSSTLQTWKNVVVAADMEAGGVVWYGGSRSEPAQYRYQNGSTVVVGGMDKATKVLSTEYDVVFADEATELTETDWETLVTRLRHGRISFQQIIGACNPDTPTHWIKQRAERGQARMIESRHEDNPRYVNQETGEPTDEGRDYLAKLDNLTGVRKLRLRDGLWAAAEGVIYDEWDPAIHLVDRFEIPDDWDRWWVVDFGFTNPFVCQWWAEDHDGRLYLYREIYRSKRLVEDHAREIFAACRQWLSDTATWGTWNEPPPRKLICDHDAEDRATLERHLGIPTTPAKKSVSDGIQAVASRLKPAEDGKPRLFILKGSTIDRDLDLVESRKPASTAEEIPGYIWRPTPDGKPSKEEPLKVNDHGVDCMRYLVAELDFGHKFTWYVRVI